MPRIFYSIIANASNIHNRTISNMHRRWSCEPHSNLLCVQNAMQISNHFIMVIEWRALKGNARHGHMGYEFRLCFSFSSSNADIFQIMVQYGYYYHQYVRSAQAFHRMDALQWNHSESQLIKRVFTFSLEWFSIEYARPRTDIIQFEILASLHCHHWALGDCWFVLNKVHVIT